MDILNYLNPENCKDSLAGELYTFAKKIKAKAESHQKRVKEIMPEFDLHDATHLAKVEETMAAFIGKDRLSQLSSIDLFLLFAAAWLHDCGMAPSDRELKLFEIIEESNDLKGFTIEEAKTFVNDNKNDIYGEFKDSIIGWTFGYNETEADLQDYLAKELCQYQEFRGGYVLQLESAKKGKQLDNLNNEIRTEYIRKTHPRRAEIYINNMEGLASTIVTPWAKDMIGDLGKICSAHGEDIRFVNKLDSEREYFSGIPANPQFAAMMLRLGDIAHFSEDRAPVVLRDAMIFKSAYSLQQWTMKEGVTYSVSDSGAISYSVRYDSPADYYKFLDYMDIIDGEIRDFQMIKDGWIDKYKIPLKEVSRKNIRYNEKVFIPARGKKFRLEQNKILNLLMGVKLYKSEYDCIRELYQNALDACRCMRSRNKSLGMSVEGRRIEFGIKKNSRGEKYLYCLDNGIGMTKDIIENFLLNVGSSYYDSAEFFRKLSSWNQDFMPISQFGIGILSCFMIGKRLEITTKNDDNDNKDNDGYISCCMEGPTEYFYYMPPTEDDREKIRDTGTLVKVFLKEEYANAIDNGPIEKLGLVMQFGGSRIFDVRKKFAEKWNKYKKYYEQWDRHLYNYVINYVNIPFDWSKVLVKLDNGDELEVFSRPYRIKFGEKGLDKSDSDFINDFIYEISDCRFDNLITNYVEFQEQMIDYLVEVEKDGIQYRSVITLPKLDAVRTCHTRLIFDVLNVKGGQICVDGIKVASGLNSSDEYSKFLIDYGILDFTGKCRPNLSVSRAEIVNVPENLETVSKTLAIKVIERILSLTIEHIENCGLSKNKSICNQIWEHVFINFTYIHTLFLNYLSSSGLAIMSWEGLNKLVGKEISVREFMDAGEIELQGFNSLKMDAWTKGLIERKLITADFVEIYEGNNVRIRTIQSNRLPDNYVLSNTYLVYVDEGNDIFQEYDIISNLYPLTSGFMFNFLREGIDILGRVKVLEVYSAVSKLYKQDPRLVNPKYRALYENGRGVYDFHHYMLGNIDMNQFYKEGKKYNSTGPRYMLSVYIAPWPLTGEDKWILAERHAEETDPEYYKGVHEGWSILATGMEENNLIIVPGKCKRADLVKKIPASFWKKYKKEKFIFPDGREVKSFLNF